MLRYNLFGKVLVISFCASARAAFVANVEHFDGTVKDTGTWSEYKQLGSEIIAQDGRLDIDAHTEGAEGIAEYRARFATVGVGGFAQVTARLGALSQYGGWFYLALSTPPYPSGDFIGSDRSVDVEGHTSVAYAFQYTGDGGSGGGGGDGYPLIPSHFYGLNQDYIYRIDYLTPTSIKYSTFDTAMNPISSLTRTLDNLPDRFYITIGSFYARASFDDLTIGGNASAPEPSLPIGLVLLCAGLSRRASRRSTAATAMT